MSIPSIITEVGNTPFNYCNNIKEVYCFLQDVNTLNKIFKGVSVGNSTLHVQSALIDYFYEYSNFDNIVALDVNIDGTYYYLDPEKLTAEVLHGNYTGNIAIPTSVEYEGNTYVVTYISSGVFKGCSGLTSISIPNTVTSPIEDEAFSGCSALTSVSIGNGVTSIGSSAFMECIGLKAVYIKDLAAWCRISCSYNGNPLLYAHHLYLNGEEVKDLVIPSSVTSIGDYVFSGCRSLISVSIPNSVTSIGSYTFNDCSALSSVTFSEGVTIIGFGAFAQTPNLTSITLPNSVRTIEGCAFWASGISSVTIPESVTTIGVDAFCDCSKLMDIYCFPKDLPSTETTAFRRSNISYATLHVPEESLDAYKNTSPWSGFGTIVSVEDNKKNYQMVVSVSDLRGIVTYGETSITNGRETFDVKEGSDVVLMLTPREGYKVKSVKVNSVEKVTEVNGEGELTIANVEDNLSVGVEFECAGDNMMATIGSNGFATFCSMEALDFSEVEDVKAYIVSAFQPKKGEVTLTRVFEVPAGMGLVLIGKEGEYEIPLCTGEAMVSNLLVGINENTTLKATENDRTNFILPEDQEKAAFCAVTDEVELPFGKAYLPLPTESVAHLEDGKLTLHLADPSLGDVDGDGYVNISDVTTLVNIILGK